ncbi:MAG: sulfatase-like hydrolase/transferase, partial [Planctomycetes bacterium]|nr:sulfatase-like hydrolase/transferase [Planctomycetota bacterium]
MRPMLLATWMLLATSCFAADRPNIVLIVSDDQGYNDLGVLSGHVITPNLDRITRQGVRLTDFYVAWPACTPSRGALLTGRYPQRNGIYDMIRNEAPDYGHKYSPESYAVTWERIGGMDTREVLLPQMLKRVGYRCGIFGKWDLGIHRRFLPLQRGWDEFYGFVNTGIDYYTHERYGVPSMVRDNLPTTEDKGTYCTYLFQREAARFIRENRNRPFFLYLPFNATHGASSLDPAIRGAAQAPEKWRKMYPDLHAQEAMVEGTRYGKAAMVPNQALRKTHYLGSVTAMDAAIGEVLDLLDEYDLAENTIVIFFSDNGGSGAADNAPLRGGKARVFEGGIRVCCAIRYPKRIPAGSVSREFLTSLEILPTLLGLTGAAVPEDVVLDGFDMMPVLAEGKSSRRKEMYWKRQAKEAARVDHWKWIRNESGTFLFDLANDVSEKNNLIDELPNKAAEMQGHFENWLKRMDAAKVALKEVLKQV